VGPEAGKATIRQAHDKKNVHPACGAIALATAGNPV